MSIIKLSAAEFKNIRSLVTAALLIALHTVLAVFISIQVTDSVRISVSFLANLVIGCLYGPVMGFVCGALGDVVQFIIKPTGPYFPGWTLSAALAVVIYGFFFYRRFPSKKVFDIKYFIRVVFAITFDTLLINVFLGTYWVTVMYGKGFAFYFTARLTKNIIQLPINVILSYCVLSFVGKIRAKIL